MRVIYWTSPCPLLFVLPFITSFLSPPSSLAGKWANDKYTNYVLFPMGLALDLDKEHLLVSMGYQDRHAYVVKMHIEGLFNNMQVRGWVYFYCVVYSMWLGNCSFVVCRMKIFIDRFNEPPVDIFAFLFITGCFEAVLFSFSMLPNHKLNSLSPHSQVLHNCSVTQQHADQAKELAAQLVARAEAAAKESQQLAQEAAEATDAAAAAELALKFKLEH